jgi:hypothetical protein
LPFTPTPAPATPLPFMPTPTPTPAQQACCVHCHTGKPCGDSCISATRTCHISGGCAC